MERKWRPYHVTIQEKIMVRHNMRNEDNSVNGNASHEDATSLGREDHVRQVTHVRYQDTVCDSRGRQAAGTGNITAKRKKKQRNKELKIGTWNVNTLNQSGKMDNLRKEANRIGVDIMGVSEVRWTGVGKTEDKEWTFYYSGRDTHESGVGILVRKEMSDSITGVWHLSDRVIVMKLKGNPIDWNIIQVYAPTSNSTEEELEEFYQELDKARQQCKPHEVTVIMGDLNAKVGNGREGEIVGDFGLGRRNERGDRWVEWCTEQTQVIMNTWFRKHVRHLYTWKSPGDQYRNQIDYITFNARFRNAVTDVRTYPGADAGVGCDHVPVVANIKLRLKKIEKPKTKRRRQWKEINENMELRCQFQQKIKDKYDMIKEEIEEQESEEHEIEREWKALQRALVETRDEMVPEEVVRRRQKWMTEEILQKMDERRRCKGIDREKYTRLDQEIKEECLRKKEEWLIHKCEEVETLDRRNTKQMFDEINEITGNKRPYIGNTISDRNGNMLMDSEDVLRRWEEYVSELYNGNRGRKPVIDGNIQGPVIMKEEIELALQGMKKGKAVGEDGTTCEMMTTTGDFFIEKMTGLTNMIYNTGYVPLDMRDNIFVTIPKQPGTTECGKHRTISIMSQMGKIPLRVLNARIKGNIQENVESVQYGFRKGKGTRNAMFILRMIIERAVEMQRNVYLCFVDFQKAFDTVEHEQLMALLQRIGIDGKDLRLIVNLYWDQRAAVRVDKRKSGWVEITKGVRQGCVLSPDLFSLYGQTVMEDIQDIEGIKVGGINVNNLRYADDTVLVADSEENLQMMVNTLNEACTLKKLKINTKKTEVMGIMKGEQKLMVNIQLENRRIKQVENFTYLGSVIADDGKSETEIKKRIGVAKMAYNKMKRILSNMSMTLSLRIRLLKCYVWSVLLYGCETWTVSKKIRKRIEAAEMWFYRRMLRISWVARVTNEEVLRRAGVGRELMGTIRERQLKFLGHVIREDDLEKTVLMGRIAGRRARGRQRIKYLDSLLMDINGVDTAGDLMRMAEEREEWRTMIANVKRDMALR